MLQSRSIVPVGLLVFSIAGCAIQPKPLTNEAILSNVANYAAKVDANQEPVNRAIDLYEATARALKYNLDHRVEIVQAALRIKELNLANYQLLPNLVASSGFASRNNQSASGSYNLITKVPNFGASTSQDRNIVTADVSFSWNILDFGVSYFRAHQAADKSLIAEETRRKVIHRIVEDVRTAYWRAVSGQRLLNRLRYLEGRVRKAQASARKTALEQNTSPIVAVTYERELVEIKRTIRELQANLVVAKSQLAALINLRPGKRFRLRSRLPGRSRLALRRSVRNATLVALHNRAELREVWYQKRINQKELNIALLELLPGINLFAGPNFNSNKYLYNNNWLSWGAKASWNLLRLVQYPSKHEVIEGQDKLLVQRGLALTMAIMTQVHVSRIRFHHAAKQLRTAIEYLRIQNKLVRLMRTEAKADRIGEQTLIREEMNTMVAEVKRDIAYAALQNAYANVYASMGLDPYASELDLNSSVKDLARKLRNIWIERGRKGPSVRRIVIKKPDDFAKKKKEPAETDKTAVGSIKIKTAVVADTTSHSNADWPSESPDD